ncbi:uncharacterized protein KY384_008437 [Bacidia gigantensis]|uniref:uncharacterized protein n=1 Tax=Bacidia gigantensis TaxID=2732470 RepID=UPI001D03D708|nr:uncharacterized protein KY384_008437 [Bacidia gigantensis]KAG8527008.1 hypothetical protein KY384_008437 [Bacidia gigantensis]
MGSELYIIAGYNTLLLGLLFAWIGGYLDPLQHQLQDVILGKMGDNRASFGAKSGEEMLADLLALSTGLMSQRVVEDKNITDVQDGAAKEVGGAVGKGGIGQGIGDTLSKGL